MNTQDLPGRLRASASSPRRTGSTISPARKVGRVATFCPLIEPSVSSVVEHGAVYFGLHPVAGFPQHVSVFGCWPEMMTP